MGYLLDNILQQRAAMQAMNQTPTKLRCDADSWDALVNEIVPLLPLYPAPIYARPTVYGLEVEISVTPNFEVI